jgi:hypothetical protein
VSLTSLIKIPAVRKEIVSRIKMPKVDKKTLVNLIPRVTGDPAKMGTAVDYAIRFWLEKKHNGKQVNPLVAELAATKIFPEFTQSKKQEAAKIVDQALEFIGNATALDDNFAYWVFQLANLDLIFRQRIMPKSIPMILSKSDIRELKSLMALAMKNWPVPGSYCLLNPTFGGASRLVGGADADVVQDSTIIDIKTVQYPGILDVIVQLVGYTVLCSMDSIDNLPIGEGIERIGVYYARHGAYLSWDLEEVISWQEVKELAYFFEETVASGTKINGNLGLGAAEKTYYEDQYNDGSPGYPGDYGDN